MCVFKVADYLGSGLRICGSVSFQHFDKINIFEITFQTVLFYYIHKDSFMFMTGVMSCL